MKVFSRSAILVRLSYGAFQALGLGTITEDVCFILQTSY